MNEKQAIDKGYGFSGVYSHDKDEVKERILTEKKLGNKAVIVTKKSCGRGYDTVGYSMYVILSPENEKAKKINFIESRIKNLSYDLKVQMEKVADLQGALEEQREKLVELND